MAALRAHRCCATTFREELGIDPGPTIQEAHRLLLAAGELPGRAQPGRPSLVGRESEWAAVQLAWQRAAAGQPGVLLPSGDAGIGKTQLAELR